MIEKPWLSATPDRPGAMEKIRQLEASKDRIPTDLDQDKKGFGIPVFIEHLNDLKCLENESIKFKCKVEPKNDPTLQIGKQVSSFLRVVNLCRHDFKGKGFHCFRTCTYDMVGK